MRTRLLGASQYGHIDDEEGDCRQIIHDNRQTSQLDNNDCGIIVTMADALSDDIVSLLDEGWAERYKCFCKCAHLRTASAVICAFDLVLNND